MKKILTLVFLLASIESFAFGFSGLGSLAFEEKKKVNTQKNLKKNKRKAPKLLSKKFKLKKLAMKN